MNQVLEKFIPRVTRPFIDNLPFRGCATVAADERLIRPEVRSFVADHIADIDQILARLEEVGQILSAEKSEFGLSRINVVGFVCSREGRHPERKKFDSIRDMAPCASVGEVCWFLGVAGFYRMFIPHFATLAEPLFELLRKGTSFD